MLTRITFLSLISVALPAAHLIYQKDLPASLVTVDPAGNLYLAYSGAVTKLDPAGNVLYSKPLALPGASWFAIAADSAGNAIIVGNTDSDALPTTPSVVQPHRNPGVCIAGDKSAQPYPCPDAFIVKLDAAGNLAWATYLGGVQTDQANAVAVDPTGAIYVTGFTQSPDFPVSSAFQPNAGGYADAFVSKISADGTRLLYSSFLGGAGYDVGRAIAVDPSGNAFVAGQIQGTVPLLSAPGGFGNGCDSAGSSAFLAKVDPTGAHLLFGGCLGGGLTYSAASAVAVDAQGNAYLAGSTNSKSFPTIPGAPYTDFLSKVTPDGSALAYSSVWPGDSFGPSTLAIDAAGFAYIAGLSGSATLPVVGPALHPCPGPAILLKLSPAGGAPVYSSFDEASHLALATDGSLYLVAASLRKLTALDSPADSFLSSDCVLNGASFTKQAIAPGEIVTLKGTGLGTLAATQVFFDDIAAPLMYVDDTQINVVAPYALAGKTQTTIQVRTPERATQPVTLPVADTSAALFPVVYNQDFSLNSAANPVSRGGAITVFLTGAGQTLPLSVDGQIWHTTGSLQQPTSAQIVNYSIFGTVSAPAPVLYAGPVPGLISGVQQINLQIPPDLPDSFLTQPLSAGTQLNLQLGPQTLTIPVVLN